MRLQYSLSIGALLVACAVAGAAFAQQKGTPAAPLPQAIAYAPTVGVTLSGSLSVANGRASIGNNSAVTAGTTSAVVTLARGGSLRVCASTSVHLSKDAAPGGVDDAGLMVAIERGAIEANYTAGKYSDVLLTPDLRILISGPGLADVKLRVNLQGDTCVDNHGYDAPYITVSSLMDGGVYRVQPNQRVLFEHGSLQQVVDREAESCGCPDAPGAEQEMAGVGGPSSTAADTAFPTAVSEGLAPAPVGPTAPVATAGQVHAQVTASLSNETPLGPPPPAAATQTGVAAPAAAAPRSSFLHRIGHAFSRLFGRS